MSATSILLLLVACASWTWLAVAALRASRVFDRLSDLDPAMPEGGWPLLSVVVPSKDEAANVERATRSLLGQDYPKLEVVAVDDRSRDETGVILDRLASADPRLTVVHVAELPAGWLGKNHASHVGATRARGDWLLFTDGDVAFARDALRRAIAYAEAKRLGHLVASPRLIAPGFLERAFVATFTLFANMRFRIWDLRRPRTSAYIGLGAFNLVRRSGYERVGGHKTLAMEVLDDVKLGLILRRSGVRQGAVNAGPLVEVRWNPGFRATFRGLLKNAFAAAEWRVGLTLVGTAFVALMAFGPWLVLLDEAGPVRWLGLAPIALAAMLHGGVARRVAGGSGAEGLAYPLSDGAFVAVLATSALLAMARGGIEWRGTRYPLRELRAGCVREHDWPIDRVEGWDA
jgi:hypothetical protein